MADPSGPDAEKREPLGDSTTKKIRHAEVQIKWEQDKPFELVFPDDKVRESYVRSLQNDPLAHFLQHYLRAASSLLEGDLNNLRPTCPRYMTGPVKVLAMEGTNGIVFRFDPKNEPPSEVIVLRNKDDLRRFLVQISNGFLQFPDFPIDTADDQKPPSTEIRFAITDASGKIVRDIGSGALAMQCRWPDSYPPVLTGRKPFCPISTSSAISIEMQGIEAREQQPRSGPTRLDSSEGFLRCNPCGL